MRQLDLPETTEIRKAFFQKKSYLKKLYEFWYNSLLDNIPKETGAVLELGTGGGFLKRKNPSLITSDVMPLSRIDCIIDARSLPFTPCSLKAIVGTNVLHHVPQIWKFFGEAIRVLRPGGRLVFIEPWPTLFSVFIYKYLHHEPFDLWADWSVASGGPLTAANGALPWIIFARDKNQFAKKYPNLKIVSLKAFMPFSYLVGGGIERRWPLPPPFFPIMRFLERPFDWLGLFALIVVEKTEG